MTTETRFSTKDAVYDHIEDQGPQQPSVTNPKARLMAVPTPRTPTLSDASRSRVMFYLVVVILVVLVCMGGMIIFLTWHVVNDAETVATVEDNTFQSSTEHETTTDNLDYHLVNVATIALGANCTASEEYNPCEGALEEDGRWIAHAGSGHWIRIVLPEHHNVHSIGLVPGRHGEQCHDETISMEGYQNTFQRSCDGSQRFEEEMYRVPDVWTDFVKVKCGRDCDLDDGFHVMYQVKVYIKVPNNLTTPDPR